MRFLYERHLAIVKEMPGLFFESVKVSVTGSAVAVFYLLGSWGYIVGG